MSGRVVFNVRKSSTKKIVTLTIDEQILNSTVAKADGVSLRAYLKAFDDVVVCLRSEYFPHFYSDIELHEPVEDRRSCNLSLPKNAEARA